MKKVSIFQIIRGVISKLGLRNVQDLPTQDMLEWAVHALTHIGSTAAVEEKVKEVEVVNYKFQAPLDMINLLRVTNSSGTNLRYKTLVNGYQVGVQDGSVHVVYTGYQLDSNGYPLFPSDVSTQEAVMWYIASFLAIQGLLPNKQLGPDYCNARWQWYCGQARATGYIPNFQQLQNMVNSFHRLLPDKESYWRNFYTLDGPEAFKPDTLND